MLDPEEMAQFEEWKEAKLTGSTDLSVFAFNKEMEALALAFDAGVRASISSSDQQKIRSVMDANPYRGAGMRA